MICDWNKRYSGKGKKGSWREEKRTWGERSLGWKETDDQGESAS